VIAQLVALHLGALHPYEKVLTLVLAFGPFVVLGAVITVRRRHEEAEDDEKAEEAEESREGASRREPDRPTAR
jgi:hypothetical protein